MSSYHNTKNEVKLLKITLVLFLFGGDNISNKQNVHAAFPNYVKPAVFKLGGVCLLVLCSTKSTQV